MVASNTQVRINAQVCSRISAQGTMFRKIILSFLIAAPFLGAGAYGFAGSELPDWASSVVFLVGVLLAVVGLVSVGRVIPPLSLVPGEDLLVSRHPTMRPAFARMILSAPFFVGAWYLFEFTLTPYVLPFVLFIVGLFLFFKGSTRYLRNLHITYTVTDRRGGAAIPVHVAKHQGDSRSQDHLHLRNAQLF